VNLLHGFQQTLGRQLLFGFFTTHLFTGEDYVGIAKLQLRPGSVVRRSSTHTANKLNRKDFGRGLFLAQGGRASQVF
jgi:hypothetical protein